VLRPGTTGPITKILIKIAPFDERPGHGVLASPHAQVALRRSPLVAPWWVDVTVRVR